MNIKQFNQAGKRINEAFGSFVVYHFLDDAGSISPVRRADCVRIVSDMVDKGELLGRALQYVFNRLYDPLDLPLKDDVGETEDE